MSDIVERLEHIAKLLGVGSYDIPGLLKEAAAEIKTLREQVPAPPPDPNERS